MMKNPLLLKTGEHKLKKIPMGYKRQQGIIRDPLRDQTAFLFSVYSFEKENDGRISLYLSAEEAYYERRLPEWRK